MSKRDETYDNRTYRIDPDLLNSTEVNVQTVKSISSTFSKSSPTLREAVHQKVISLQNDLEMSLRTTVLSFLTPLDQRILDLDLDRVTIKAV